MSEYQEFLEEAVEIAEDAAQVALGYFRQALLIETKENNTPVTIADKKTEEKIRNEIMQIFPDHGILGEEFGLEIKDSDYVWTIDPIDGTRSFIRGIPLFGTLLGLLHKGEPVIGVVVLPALGETYVGAKGMGAQCNGHTLRVSAVSAIESAVIACGDMTCFDAVGKKKALHKLIDKAELVRGYTDCFGHSLVLRGSVDAMIDPAVALWDIAPLACLIREAGGEYYAFDGEANLEKQSFITSNGDLKKELVSLFG